MRRVWAIKTQDRKKDNEDDWEDEDGNWDMGHVPSYANSHLDREPLLLCELSLGPVLLRQLPLGHGTRPAARTVIGIRTNGESALSSLNYWVECWWLSTVSIRGMPSWRDESHKHAQSPVL